MFKSRVRPLRHELLETRRVLDGSGLGAAAGEPAPDYSLVDVNSTSPLVGQTVSSANFAGTTAIYFIHST